MSYGTDNDLSRPNFNPAQGAPTLGANDRVLGVYEQGRGAVHQPAQQPATQPQFNAPPIAPAAQPTQHNYQQPQTYQPQYGQPVQQQQPTYVPQTPLTPTLNQPAAQDTPPVPVKDPITGQWVLPQSQPMYGNPDALAAPAQPAYQAPVQQPAAQAPTVGNSYIETSINHLTSSLGVSADTFDSVIAAAVQYGDMNLINPAALGVQLTPEQTAQVKQLAQGAVQYVQAENSRVESIVHAVAGGKAQWDQAASTFNSVANQDTKNYVAYLLDNNQHEAASQLVINTVRGMGYQPQGQAPLQPSAIAGQQGLSSTAFKDALGKLYQEIGSGSLETGINKEKFDNLRHLRELGRQQGLA